MVFLRYPEAGKAKTRLISELGAEGAAVLARELAERTLDVAEAALPHPTGTDRLLRLGLMQRRERGQQRHRRENPQQSLLKPP